MSLKGVTVNVKNHKALYLLNVVVMALFLLPFLWTLSTSLKEPRYITDYPPKWVPPSLSFEHYKAIWNVGNGAFTIYFMNSVIVTAFTAFFVVVMGALAGYGFAKLEIPFKRVIFLIILTALMVPFQSLLIPLFNLMSNLNLLNTHVALILIYVTFQLPFGVFMMTNAFEAIPTSLREAALMDGAGEFRTFVRVMLPVAWPGLATVAIFSAYTTWNDFIINLVFTTDEEMRTLNVGLTNLALGQYGTDWGLLTSGAVVSSIPIMLLFIFLQRYFIAGLTGGAVK
jgi:multiple sugar transport system permease protein